MDGVSVLLNLAVGVWLLAGLAYGACRVVPPLARYTDRVLRWSLVMTAVLLALMGLMRFVRMEE